MRNDIHNATVALKVAPHKHSFVNVPLANVPLANVPLANVPLANVPLANVPLANVPLVNVPLVNSPLTNVPSRTFSPRRPLQTFPHKRSLRLQRGLALPHSSACEMNEDTQHDRAQ